METLRDLRKLWIINIFLDCRNRIQKLIPDELIDIGKKMGDCPDNPLNNINQQIISPIIKYLEDERHIIKREEEDIKGKNMKQNICSLPQDIETFVNIVTEIADSKVSESRKSFFGRCLLNSEYGRMFVNNELLPNLLKHYNLPEINLKDNEKQFVKKILHASPLALNYLILSISNQSPEYHESDAKEKLLMMLQTFLSLDLIDPFSGILYSAYPNKINFKTTVSFSATPSTNNETKYPDLKIGIKDNCLESTIDHTTYAKKMSPEMVIKAYLETYRAPDNPEYMEKI